MYPLEVLAVPAAKRNQFRAKGIETVEDLIRWLPRKYYDFRRAVSFRDLTEGAICAVRGTVHYRDKGDRFCKVEIVDACGDTMQVVWWNTTRPYKILKAKGRYTFCGKISIYQGQFQMCNPISFGSEVEMGILPVYSKIKGMSEQYLRERIQEGISFLEAQHVPCEKDMLATKFGLIDYMSAVKMLHSPEGEEAYKNAKKRYDFERIYDFYEAMKRDDQQNVSPLKIKTSALADAYIKKLPFCLTDGQKDVFRRVRDLMTRRERVNGLVNGDVGAGKTIIAILLSILICENSGQVLIVAPTQMLCQQHYQDFSTLKDIGLSVSILTNQTSAPEKRKLLNRLTQGETNILIGTHAALSQELEFRNIGLTIVDEEQRFGSSQKAVLENYAKYGAHHLAMTATPIPRSLARTMYGNRTKVFTIDTMPAGRSPVKTIVTADNEPAFSAILTAVKNGNQAYIVCPFIEESISERFSDVASIQSTEEDYRTFCKKKSIEMKIASVNSTMKSTEIEDTFHRFRNHEIDVLIATTIVEVGINVPNATVMVIMSAERYGLAVLHQLRGRVGRGAAASMCYLVSKTKTPRLEVLCTHYDGFQIAEEDLRLRGTGDLTGVEQSGFYDIISLLHKKPKTAAVIRDQLNI